MSTAFFLVVFGALPVAAALLQNAFAEDFDRLVDQAGTPGATCDGMYS